jgi:hypothetical protein
MICPASLAQVTPAWLSEALSQRFPGVTVRSASITHLIEGTATKARLALDYQTRPDGAPDAVWVKGGFSLVGAHQGDAFANEVNFYRDVAPLLTTNRPDVYGGVIDPVTHNGVLVLEDLGRRGARFGHAAAPLTPDQAREVLAMQAGFHARFWDGAGLERFDWLSAGGSILESNMIEQFLGLWGAAEPLPRFAHVREAQKERARIGEALTVMLVADAVASGCFVHGDSHIANLFFEADGRPGYLDWQHVMRGSWAFDAANLMITGLSVADRRAHERDLLSGYLEALAAAGVAPPSLEEAWDAYAAHAMWSFMWALCPVAMHSEEVCTLNAERACTAIEDLDTLHRLAPR